MRKVVNDYISGELEVPTIEDKYVDLSIFNLIFSALKEQDMAAKVLSNMVKKYSDLNAAQADAIIQFNANSPKEEVNHPEHYNSKSKETIDVIKEFMDHEAYYGFLLGNVIKYLERANLKGGKVDLKKAEWYFNRYLIECPNPKFQTLDSLYSELNQQA